MGRFVKFILGIGSVVAPFQPRPYSLSSGFAADRQHLRRDVRRFGGDVKTTSAKAKSHQHGSATSR
jgi:hypothetical protein